MSSSFLSATTLPDITDDRTNFTIYDVSGRPCLQASFELNFNIYYNSSGDSNGKLQVWLHVDYACTMYV